jgi:hypothetical protein
MLANPHAAIELTRTDSLPSARQRWTLFTLAWLVLSLIAATWSIATPIGGAPDEPAHIIKAAAVARGEITEGQRVEVPAYIAYIPAQTCYAFQPQVTPACSAPLSGDASKIVGSSTSAALYNPLYYALVGWPSLVFHDDSGVYAMRIVSGIVSSLFLAASLIVISTWRRRLFPLMGFAIAATPMVFFLNGVVNPNSLETTATLAAFTAVFSIVWDKRAELVVERSIIATIGAAVAVNTRGLSPLWVAIAVLTPFILTRWSDIRELTRRRAVIMAIVAIGVSAAGALAWIAVSNSLGAGLTPTKDTISSLGVGASPLAGFTRIFEGTFDYGQGLIGVFGWLDTPVPSAVFFVWSGFIAVIVVASLVLLRGRALALALALVSALLLLPPITQGIYIIGGGLIWQGRYALALFVCVIMGLTALLSERVPEPHGRIRRRLMMIVFGGWGIAQTYSFAFALKRYGVGAEHTSWRKLLVDPMWAPPGGVPLAIIAYTVFIVLATVLLYRLANRESVTRNLIKHVGEIHDGILRN